METKKIAVIILNYNNSKDTINLTNQLLKQEKVHLEVTIVDNCSTDNSLSNLLSRINSNKVNVIKSDFNGGYAYGNNFALKSYLKANIDYVAILNPDISINNRNLFYNLKERFNSLHKPGFIAPASIDSSGNINSYCAKKCPKFFHEILSSFLFFSKLAASINSYNLKKRDEDEIPVDILSGSFLFTEFSFFNDINFFDEGTFLFCEERILYKKTNQKSRFNYLIKDINIKHYESSTIGKIYSNIDQVKIFHKSLLYYYKNYASFGSIKCFIIKPFLWLLVLQLKILNLFKRLT